MPIAQTVRIRPFCTVAVDFVAECGCENADVQKAFLDPNHFSHKAMSRLGPPLNCRKLIAAHTFIEYPSAKILRFQEKSGVSPKKKVFCAMCAVHRFPSELFSLKASKTLGISTRDCPRRASLVSLRTYRSPAMSDRGL